VHRCEICEKQIFSHISKKCCEEVLKDVIFEPAFFILRPPPKSVLKKRLRVYAHHAITHFFKNFGKKEIKPPEHSLITGNF